MAKQRELPMHWAIRTSIKKFDLVQSHIAQNAGIDEKVVSSYLNGHRDIRGESAFELLFALPEYARNYALSLFHHQGDDVSACHAKRMNN